MLEVLVGFMVAAWAFTVGIGVYAIHRFCYQPWKVMRADVAALAARQAALETDVKQEMGLRKALLPDEADMARMEVRNRARTWAANV